MKNLKYLHISGILVGISLLMGACTANTVIRLPKSVSTPILPSVTASVTVTPTLTLVPTRIESSTPLPSPTATPQAHIVKLGETLGGIAWTYGVSLESLLALNPEVNPNAMKVGITVLIPADKMPPGDLTPQPTALSLPIRGLNCLADSNAGIWCFGWLDNSAGELMESGLVNVNVADLSASQVHSATAVLPLNTLQAGEVMPFAVYFEAPMPSEFQSSAQFSSAIPLDERQNLFPRIMLSDFEIHLVNSGQANLRGSYILPEGSAQIWIVAVAENSAGEIIGLRRWQSAAGNSGEFHFSVYAVSDEIATVKLFAEGQP